MDPSFYPGGGGIVPSGDVTPISGSKGIASLMERVTSFHKAIHEEALRVISGGESSSTPSLYHALADSLSREGAALPEESRLAVEDLVKSAKNELQTIEEALAKRKSVKRRNVVTKFKRAIHSSKAQTSKVEKAVQAKSAVLNKATPAARVQTARETLTLLRTKPRHEVYMPPISEFVREPLHNLTKKAPETLTPPEEHFSRLVKFEEFQTTLRHVFAQTLTEILKSPPAEQEYIIIAEDDAEKSTDWVTAQLLDMMSIHPPKMIVKREHLKHFLLENPNIKHVVMVDDGAYSGTQACQYLRQLGPYLKAKTVHACIPYITDYAKDRINNTFIEKKIDAKMHYPRGQKMLSYEQLFTLGYYGYSKMIRPDINLLLKIKPLTGTEAYIISFNAKLKLLQRDVFKIKDADLVRFVNEFIAATTELKLKFPNNCELVRELEDVSEQFILVTRGDGRFGVDSALAKAQFDEYRTKIWGDPDIATQSRTNVWMPHKSADSMSTDEVVMARVTGRKKAVEPYKKAREVVEKRKKELDEIIRTDPSLHDQWIEIREKESLTRIFREVDFVKTNRGCFILGSNYLEEIGDYGQVILSKGSDTIPIGGQNGAYQWKLNEGDSFALQHLEKIHQIQLTSFLGVDSYLS